MFGSVLHTLGKEALWGIIRSVSRVQGRFSGSQRIACPHLQMPTYFLASMLPRETDGSQGARITKPARNFQGPTLDTASD